MHTAAQKRYELISVSQKALLSVPRKMCFDVNIAMSEIGYNYADVFTLSNASINGGCPLANTFQPKKLSSGTLYVSNTRN